MLTVLVCLLIGIGQDAPKPVPAAIRLPEFVTPTPTPKPPINAVPVLPAEKYYIVDSDTELFVRTAPAGMLAIEAQAGPLTFPVKSLVEGGTGKFKTFHGKFIYVVEAVGSGRAELFLIPKGVADDKQILQVAIDAGNAPRPPPDPDPTPPKPVDPSPFAGDGFRCLIVYETQDLAKMPTAQEQIIFDKSIRDYLNAKAAIGPDGKTREWRIYDQNIDLTADAKVWQDTMRRERKSVPWIYVGNGKSGFEGPLPRDTASTLALLKKFGGE